MAVGAVISEYILSSQIPRGERLFYVERGKWLGVGAGVRCPKRQPSYGGLLPFVLPLLKFLVAVLRVSKSAS